MISLIAKWWIHPGNEEVVTEALKKMTSDIELHEPGTLSYQVYLPAYQKDKQGKPLGDTSRPGTVFFHEIYEDWDAQQAHLNGDIFKGFMKDYGGLFIQAHPEDDSPNPNPYMQFEFLDKVGGFAARSQ